MARAFEELFGVPAPVEAVPMGGRTDAWVLAQLATARGIDVSPSQAIDFRDAYLRLLPLELEQPGPRKGIMPGVRPLLDALVGREHMHLALLTGNYERSARAKLEYFDLWRYFRGGAFGDAALDRNHLFQDALTSIAGHRGKGAPGPDTVLVIGDTPLDVACAKSGGARSIAVATGNHPVGELRASGADVVFDDLSETARVLEAIEQLAG